MDRPVAESPSQRSLSVLKEGVATLALLFPAIGAGVLFIRYWRADLPDAGQLVSLAGIAELATRGVFSSLVTLAVAFFWWLPRGLGSVIARRSSTRHGQGKSTPTSTSSARATWKRWIWLPFALMLLFAFALSPFLHLIAGICGVLLGMYTAHREDVAANAGRDVDFSVVLPPLLLLAIVSAGLGGLAEPDVVIYGVSFRAETLEDGTFQLLGNQEGLVYLLSCDHPGQPMHVVSVNEVEVMTPMEPPDREELSGSLWSVLKGRGDLFPSLRDQCPADP